MCEFNVVVNGEKVFEDVIYAKEEDGRVILRDILGETKDFPKHRIVEVDVNKTLLVLSPIR